MVTTDSTGLRNEWNGKNTEKRFLNLIKTTMKAVKTCDYS